MDFDAFDRGAVEYLVATEHGGTIFYLNDERLPTDVQTRATRYRYPDEAAEAARVENLDPNWRAIYPWRPVRRIMGGALLW